MGLIPEATFLHIEVSSAIDQTYRRLKDGERELSLHERLERVRSAAQRIGVWLQDHYAREREDLFPRVQRVMGPDAEEVAQLVREQKTVLSAYEDFIEELSDAISQDGADWRVRLSFLERLFDEFVRRYEERRDIEQSFYQVHSTLLYPGGASTE